MLLDLIIPHYNETPEQGRKMFDMLRLQRMVDFDDFRVILVHDGEEHRFPENANPALNAPYPVTELTIPHRGVSAARNAGLDFSDAKWVMFCDFDDCFTDVYSLYSIMTLLGTEDHDLLWSPFYVEMAGGKQLKPAMELNWQMIHGKIFRRKFLVDRQLRFNEDLYFSEDTAFCNVVWMEIDMSRVGKIKSDLIPYTWTFRPGSLTTDPKRKYSNAVGLFRRQLYVSDEHRKRGNNAMADAFLVRAMCDAYVTLNRSDFAKTDKSDFRREVWTCYEPIRTIFIDVDERIMKAALSGAIRESFCEKADFDLCEEDLFRKWLADFKSEMTQK